MPSAADPVFADVVVVGIGTRAFLRALTNIGTAATPDLLNLCIAPVLGLWFCAAEFILIEHTAHSLDRAESQRIAY